VLFTGALLRETVSKCIGGHRSPGYGTVFSLVGSPIPFNPGAVPDQANGNDVAGGAGVFVEGEL